MVCRQFVLDILLGSSYPWTIEENELLSVKDSREFCMKFGEHAKIFGYNDGGWFTFYRNFMVLWSSSARCIM